MKRAMGIVTCVCYGVENEIDLQSIATVMPKRIESKYSNKYTCIYTFTALVTIGKRWKQLKRPPWANE